MTNEMPRNMDETRDKISPSNNIWWAIIILAVFFAGSIIIYIWTFGTSISTSQEIWGQFGDYLGGLINPVVGFITIILLIITLNTQRQELSLQREDVRRSADALDAQYKAIQIQSFEQTLFKWFDNYRSLMQEIEYTTTIRPSGNISEATRITLHGLKAIRRILSNVKLPQYIAEKTDPKNSESVLNLSKPEIEAAYDDIKESVNKMQKNEQQNVTTALRTLYGIFKWIHTSDTPGLTDTRRATYAAIIRAQLSEAELRLLFLNGIGARGKKFSRYANEYAIFDNMLAANSAIVNLILASARCPYTDRAFGGQLPQAIKAKMIESRDISTQA